MGLGDRIGAVDVAMSDDRGMAYDQDLADRLRVALGDEDGVTEKRMFGGLAFLVNRHLAVAASSASDLMVRIDPADATEFLTQDGVAQMEMRGRPMTGWIRVGLGALDRDGDLQLWVDRGVRYARGLPPK